MVGGWVALKKKSVFKFREVGGPVKKSVHKFSGETKS